MVIWPIVIERCLILDQCWKNRSNWFIILVICIIKILYFFKNIRCVYKTQCVKIDNTSVFFFGLWSQKTQSWEKSQKKLFEIQFDQRTFTLVMSVSVPSVQHYEIEIMSAALTLFPPSCQTEVAGDRGRCGRFHGLWSEPDWAHAESKHWIMSHTTLSINTVANNAFCSPLPAL